MKILAYEVREDELTELTHQAEKLWISLETSNEVPTVENAALAAGCQGVSILGQGKIDKPLTDSNRHIIDRESIAKMKDSGSFSTVPGASWRTSKRWWRVSRVRKSAHWAWTPARETMVSSTPTTGWTSHPAETGSASTSSAMSL